MRRKDGMSGITTSASFGIKCSNRRGSDGVYCRFMAVTYH
jgi:hypothetical protein